MRQRALDTDGDYNFGLARPFLIDTPACVAQAIMTRLRLAAGEWFLDLNEGTAYDQQVLGFGTAGTRDLAVRTRVLDTPGVDQISEYISFLDPGRTFTVALTVDTPYGQATLASQP